MRGSEIAETFSNITAKCSRAELLMLIFCQLLSNDWFELSTYIKICTSSYKELYSSKWNYCILMCAYCNTDFAVLFLSCSFSCSIAWLHISTCMCIHTHAHTHGVFAFTHSQTDFFATPVCAMESCDRDNCKQQSVLLLLICPLF